MSYVIQNFSKFNTHIVITPRFKIFLSLRSLNLFFFLFKFKNFSYFNFFFNKGIVKFFYNLLLNLFANYSNKISLTGIYWNFKNLDEFFNKNTARILFPVDKSVYFYNLYFLSIKIINIKLAKTYFKNVFFFFIFFLSETWYQFHNHFSFYLNFFFIRNNFAIYKFYNGYFLRVYNF